MPTRLLLDGEDLRSLMLRVKTEMGPGARIVKAERIRTGGIGGFFAKEHYELTVEVPDAPHRVHPGRRIHQRGARPGDAAGADGGAAGIEALLDAADAAEAAEAVTAPEPEISTTSPSFAEVLESLGQIVGPQARTAAPADDVAVAVDDVVLADDVVDDAVPDRASPPLTPDPAPPAPPAAGATVGLLLELGLPTSYLAGLGDLHAAVPLSTLVRRFPPAPVLRLDGGVVVVVGEPDAALRTAMQMAYRAGIDAPDVVLAGEAASRPGEGRRVRTPDEAARVRAGADGGAVTLVALGVATAADGRHDAGAQLLEALAPDQAWAVVDARRRVAETRRWLRNTGARRPLDAVAVMGGFEAQAPGAVLNLGLPVGWLDGLPASPVVWAAVLSERLSEDATWE
ncbi:hypothetical protein [Actinotalea sp. JY-7876]|uniref:hypothetical protein n=2 Tax=unclassified Actinotalea TaxID=2638618 RepID=UPI0015F3825C|nr:hypothetical protein [Actinotalea sp. JY-7876]